MDLNRPEVLEELIEGCLRNERKYQELLHKAFYSKMLVVCMRYTRDRAEAEDLLHDGFIKMYQKLKHFNYQGSFEGWLRRLMVNNAIDYIRRKREFATDLDVEHPHLVQQMDNTDEDMDQFDINQFKAQQIIDAIQKLTPAYKMVFNLYVVEELSHKEIADRLGISIGTSKSNLSKAKVKIREMLEKP